MVVKFIFALAATFGYSIVFNVPKKLLHISAIGGALGWLSYTALDANMNSPVTAAFIAASVVAIWSEILAGRVQDLVTIFIIPGIIPLVPGSGMYYTMLAIIEKEFGKAAVLGSETLSVAAAISSALIMVSSISRVIRGRKIMGLK
jgi:uncharacterized membrane protein YjjB (DUF3815 family)